MKVGRTAAAGLLLLAGCQGADTGVYWEFERMIVQPRYSAYGESRFFADGRTMQAPPAGTLPRDEGGGELPGAGGAGTGLAEQIPIPVTAELLRTGRERFDIHCATCHGVLGDGASPVARKMQLRPPPSLHLARIRAFSAGRLFQVVQYGYGLMPSYAGVLSVRERWAVVAYVQALQLSQNAPITELPGGVRAEVERELARRNGQAAGEVEGIR